MGLFNYFNKKSNGVEARDFSTTAAKPDIPEDIFAEKENMVEKKREEKNPLPLNENENGISVLFQFLERNHQAQGYEDALVNPDSTHLDQNINALKNELERIIRKVKTFYEDFIMEIDFHIKSRSRSGMVDTVDELNMKKEIAQSHMKKVLEIENDSIKNQGDSQGIVMSYTKGFRNGLAAISHHAIMNKKL